MLKLIAKYSPGTKLAPLSPRLTTSHLSTVRGPCPGLNTLANHGLLPHSGQNITVDDLAYGMLAGVNQDESISLGLFNILVREGLTSGNTTDSTFSLEGLGRHNVLEHDASLR